MTATGGSAVRLEVDPKAAAIASRLARDLVRIFTALGATATRRGTGLVLLVDETHRADDVGFRAVLIALSECRDHGVPMLVVAGGLPTIPRLSRRTYADLDDLVLRWQLEPLSDEAAKTALSRPASDRAVDWEPEALAAGIDWAEGNPWCLQLVGRHAWNRTTAARISAPHVRAAIAAARSDLHSVAERTLRSATSRERNFIDAMLEFGPGPYTALELVAAEDRFGEDPEFLTPALALVRLLGKEIIVADYAYESTEFVMPKFHELLAGRSPGSAAQALATGSVVVR